MNFNMTKESTASFGDTFQPWVSTEGLRDSIIPSTQELVRMQEIRMLLKTRKFKEAKKLIRGHGWPINHPIRRELWLDLLEYKSGDHSDVDEYYEETSQQLFGEKGDRVIASLPTFVEERCKGTYHLNAEGIKVATRVLNVLGFCHPDITYSPQIYCLTCLLLHYYSEKECYSIMSKLVSMSKGQYISQTKLRYEAIWRSLIVFTKNHAKPGLTFISRHCQNNDNIMERVFEGWAWWIFKYLPFSHLVRVMDCFFCEGSKVLYRVSMTLVTLFAKHCENHVISSASLEAVLQEFIAKLPVPPEKLLRMSFGIRNFGSPEINRVLLKTEMTLKSKQHTGGTAGLTRTRSLEALPHSVSQSKLQMMSHSLTIKEGHSSPQTKNRHATTMNLGDFKCHLLSRDQLWTLWNWLPTRYTMYQPTMLYTTEEHGSSLMTFYKRVENHEPTILVIKTFENELFGAYCSTKWSERNKINEHGWKNTYFGTGESFVFRLQPSVQRYQWVGITMNEANEGPSCMRHAAELFQAADNEMIAIGGGNGQAIWIDGSMRYGKTESCQTFNNPPLCDSKDFQVGALEVYGFSEL